jgi:hypothetical protein
VTATERATLAQLVGTGLQPSRSYHARRRLSGYFTVIRQHRRRWLQLPAMNLHLAVLHVKPFSRTHQLPTLNCSRIPHRWHHQLESRSKKVESDSSGVRRRHGRQQSCPAIDGGRAVPLVDFEIKFIGQCRRSRLACRGRSSRR